MTLAALKSSSLPFPFELTRSRRKTLVVYVKGGKVEVRSPLRASSEWILSFLTDKSPWIQTQLEVQRLKQRERLIIADNRFVPFLGQPRLIQVIIGTQQKVVLHDEYLYFFVRETHRGKLEQLFNNWLLQQAKEYMATQTIKYARLLGVEHKFKNVVFRRTKSKWGHCCQDGTIQYNWLAMMAPRDVINYLIAHETSHLKHLNHSAKFWNTVALLCPNYKELRHWLGENGHRFWVETKT
ncbi:MAG: M48 family metallopeptidase [Pseudomonadales bacterium]|jgi:predicted metal-dependent hydrolase|nr:M48 family metallopeptidase [Pseudomonadales bacterium]